MVLQRLPGAWSVRVVEGWEQQLDTKGVAAAACTFPALLLDQTESARAVDASRVRVRMPASASVRRIHIHAANASTWEAELLTDQTASAALALANDHPSMVLPSNDGTS